MTIIGIITRNEISEEGHNTKIIYKDIYESIAKNGGIPIGIILDNNYKKLIDMCDGVIFQGGDSFEHYDFIALEYAYKMDKPVLGICLGMQLMGQLFNGKLISVNNHKKKLSYAHSVKINKNSLLYKIYKSECIKVNSRHKECVINTTLNISGLSNDNIIEAIEAKGKKFFLGVQWHPESMIDYDNNQNKLFEYFMYKCKK